MIASLNDPTDSRRLKRDRSAELFTRTSFGRFDSRCMRRLLASYEAPSLKKMNPPLVRPSDDNLAVVCMRTRRVVCSLAHNWRGLYRNRIVL